MYVVLNIKNVYDRFAYISSSRIIEMYDNSLTFSGNDVTTKLCESICNYDSTSYEIIGFSSWSKVFK